MVDKKYHCQNCGMEITLEEYEKNDGLCDECAWDEDDMEWNDDLFLGGGW